MKDYIRKRVVEVASYTIENKPTIRETAKEFRISKSTIHKDLTERLPKVDKGLYNLALEVIKVNKKERHIRGGIATKNKYLKQVDTVE